MEEPPQARQGEDEDEWEDAASDAEEGQEDSRAVGHASLDPGDVSLDVGGEGEGLFCWRPSCHREDDSDTAGEVGGAAPGVSSDDGARADEGLRRRAEWGSNATENRGSDGVGQGVAAGRGCAATATEEETEDGGQTGPQAEEEADTLRHGGRVRPGEGDADGREGSEVRQVPLGIRGAGAPAPTGAQTGPSRAEREAGEEGGAGAQNGAKTNEVAEGGGRGEEEEGAGPPATGSGSSSDMAQAFGAKTKNTEATRSGSSSDMAQAPGVAGEACAVPERRVLPTAGEACAGEAGEAGAGVVGREGADAANDDASPCVVGAKTKTTNEAADEAADEDDHNYEITDFSMVTPWERLIQQVEDILKAWGVGGGLLGGAWDSDFPPTREHTVLNYSQTKGVRHRSQALEYDGRKLVLRHVTWLPEGTAAGSGGVCGVERLWQKRSSAATSANYIHELGCCLGLGNYLILIYMYM